MALVGNRVALISGIARGQGRSDALRLAQEGADIIGFDVAADDPVLEYPLATKEDLAETVRQIEAIGRRTHIVVADVRDYDAVEKVIADGVKKLGRLDFVIANAGIAPVTNQIRFHRDAFVASIEVMLTGVFNTIYPSIPYIKAGGQGGAIVIHGSTIGVVGGILTEPSPGEIGYAAAKHGVVGVMHTVANALAADSIRVNVVHATAVRTPMVVNEAMARHFRDHPELAKMIENPLPTPGGMLEPSDVTNTVLHLVSDAGRYITGQSVVVDAGYTTYR
ncbi:mycofactocin-coupled SDR family oxidoreductase [Actinoplanes sp. TBRC 11911]|uniref:mycofactocin-coupled SDR family oxidoreductase n=1 Tax=Actinoplanes sp. TBRC 11911 TaxID=2729386 RepID=UPI00145E8423|nr:mycofactocin-coupled SDR family oxidoreductase [Actinoplanes sp. TBRC 11911]NMO55349.1 mycofactocin-coupled SDR family oxidoreductase [Actinoplanes sp. TBRC 11911]